jgi:hypothetical protein
MSYGMNTRADVTAQSETKGGGANKQYYEIEDWMTHSRLSGGYTGMGA